MFDACIIWKERERESSVHVSKVGKVYELDEEDQQHESAATGFPLVCVV